MAQAVGLAAIEGTTEASRQLGIALGTVDRWWHDPKYGSYAEAQNADIAAAYQIGGLPALRRMLQVIPRTKDLSKLAVAVGILHDKRALLLGDATARTEHRDLPADADALVIIETAIGALSAGGLAAGLVPDRKGARPNGSDAVPALLLPNGDPAGPKP